MKKQKAVALFVAALFSYQAQAAWQLQHADLHFVTTKITTAQQTVSEVGTFKGVEGSLSDAGELQLKIDPLTVDTGIELRDGRLRDWVFAAQKYAAITLAGKIDLAALKDLPAGGATTLTPELTLTIRDKNVAVKTPIDVVRDDHGGFFVALSKPLLVNASAFGLDDGIAQLVTVAKLGLIAKQIPVTFSGHFASK